MPYFQNPMWSSRMGFIENGLGSCPRGSSHLSHQPCILDLVTRFRCPTIETFPQINESSPLKSICQYFHIEEESILLQLGGNEFLLGMLSFPVTSRSKPHWVPGASAEKEWGQRAGTRKEKGEDYETFSPRYGEAGGIHLEGEKKVEGPRSSQNMGWAEGKQTRDAVG